ncbi:unnamed protein product [Staurois parvus]|uniref:Beta-sarcoglycan n=1 Tax=Staurois parvus TaxID=386267 RepID=A0ABN9CWR4_9NEOB|nr:unnamed protein product [Staurois parvus]
MEFVDPRTQNTLFSTDYEKHEFHLPKGVKTLNVQKASTERITSSASSDLKINVDGHITVRGNEGVFCFFHHGKDNRFSNSGNIVLKAENSIVLNGSVMVTPSRLPTATGELMYDDGTERYKLCMCADGTLFRVLVESRNMGCLTSVNPCGSIY